MNTTDCVGKSSKEPVTFSGIRLLVVFLFMLAAVLQLLARAHFSLIQKQDFKVPTCSS